MSSAIPLSLGSSPIETKIFAGFFLNCTHHSFHCVDLNFHSQIKYFTCWSLMPSSHESPRAHWSTM